MKLETFVYRINLFGVIWGTIVNLTFALSGGFGSELGVYAYHSFAAGFSSLLFGELVYSLLGVLVAVPFALALNIAELMASDKQRFAPWFVLKVASVANFCTFIWFVFGPGTQYGPEGFFSGGLRVGLTGFIAALITSYFISRYYPDEVYQDNRFLASVVLIIELLVISSSLLFPTLQKVRGNQSKMAAVSPLVANMVGKAT